MCTGRRRDCALISLGISGCIISVGLLSFIAWRCSRRCRGKPIRSNSQFLAKGDVEKSNEKLLKMNHFQSGSWLCKYFQHGQWHEQHLVTLSFNPETLQVTGSGSDDIGNYSVEGTYSLDTVRLAMVKSYGLVESENIAVTIQLTWNIAKELFEGKWYVQTKKYHDEDKIELKFDKIRTLLTSNK